MTYDEYVKARKLIIQCKCAIRYKSKRGCSLRKAASKYSIKYETLLKYSLEISNLHPPINEEASVIAHLKYFGFFQNNFADSILSALTDIIPKPSMGNWRWLDDLLKNEQ